MLQHSAADVLLWESYSSCVAVCLPVGPSTIALRATGASCMISGCHKWPTTWRVPVIDAVPVLAGISP